MKKAPAVVDNFTLARRDPLRRARAGAAPAPRIDPPAAVRGRAAAVACEAMRRSDQRRDAVFALYQREVTGRPLEDLLAGSRPFTRRLAEATDAELGELDAEIARLSRGWELDRIAQLERSIMRVALHEINDPEGVPTEIAIDEAVNLAKEYCGAEAPGFVNGILGSAARERAKAAK